MTTWKRLASGISIRSYTTEQQISRQNNGKLDLRKLNIRMKKAIFWIRNSKFYRWTHDNLCFILPFILVHFLGEQPGNSNKNTHYSDYVIYIWVFIGTFFEEFKAIEKQNCPEKVTNNRTKCETNTCKNKPCFSLGCRFWLKRQKEHLSITILLGYNVR